MDWKNIDLESAYEADQNIIDALSFSTLLLEVDCNIRDINEETIRAQFMEDLNSRIESAKEVFENNLKNIVKKAKSNRAQS
jgi:formiminotetrahydrofolate cyclodeaminase